MTITLSPRMLRLTVVILLIATGVLAGMAVSAAMAGAAGVQDTAYTAVTPCASFDSRSDTGTLANKYSELESRTFQITGVAPVDQQAGVDCGVPAGATAALINVVAVQADAIGNLRAFATGETGTGGIVNYSQTATGLNNSNAVVIPLSGSGQLDIQNNCGGCAGVSVHARGIILGYYTDNLALQVAALTTQVDQLTTLLTGVTRTGDNLAFPGNINADNAPSTVLCPGCDLTGANLTGANLTNANLANANLFFANLTGANMNNAFLDNANMPGANMTGANMTGANLFFADLTGAGLANANMTNALVGYANMTNANMTNANLTGADLTGANLTNANLTGANLTVTVWSNTTCPDGTNSDTNGTAPSSCIGHL